MDSELRAQLDALLDRIRGMGSVVVAYSGGVDSSLALKLAVMALGPQRVLAVTGRSPSVAAAEIADAPTIAAELGAPHEFLDTDEFTDSRYLANPTNRCYFCKTELYGRLRAWAASRGYENVINGVNRDDLSDHRPGLIAADEHGIRAPLAECGIGKARVRELAAALGMSIADKPASPCLSSRVQYGESITREKLEQIDRAESFLKRLGFRECRVRHHHDIARIEVPASEIARFADATLRNDVERALREFGYRYVTLDLRGFRSGSMNEVLLGAGLKGKTRSGAD